MAISRIVLLKNDGALPLATDKPLKIAMIGGYAQQGVISGTGSGAVANGRVVRVEPTIFYVF